jgi:hypothetical protein
LSLDFNHIRIYVDTTDTGFDVYELHRQLSGNYFPSCSIDIIPISELTDVQGQKSITDELKSTTITNTKLPFERQPKESLDFTDSGMILYDGWKAQEVLSKFLSCSEHAQSYLHLLFTDFLILTFDNESFRYHARTVVFGEPAIISIAGIVEGPARPSDYYLDKARGIGAAELHSIHGGSYIDHGDNRLTAVSIGCALQAAFYYIEGWPFCDNCNCRLYNSHWQQDLIRTQVNFPELCRVHKGVLETFNARINC